MLAQQERGEAPYVAFPLETVTRLAYMMSEDGVIEEQTKKEKDGRWTTGKVLVGGDIKRYLAVSQSGVQIYYNSVDGVTYELNTTNNPRIE